MKKSLIAIAVLTAAGAASAQSSLNLYGVADVWVGKTKNGDLELGNGGLAGSRLGFRGTEDLGSGLKASFNLEQAVKLTNGETNSPASTPAGQTFDRQANISLSGGFGTVKLGRSFTAFDDINGAANSGFDSALSATDGTWVGYTGSANAQIYYASPVISGVSGAVGFTLSGNQTAADPTNDITSLHLKYASGPIYAGFAYQSEARVGAAPAIKHMLINGSYDLGVGTLKASYRSVNDPKEYITAVILDSKTNEYQIGFDYPVNSSLTLSVGYALSQTDIKRTTTNQSGRYVNVDAFSVAAGYSLSKRSTVYGGLRVSERNSVKDNFLAAGINHAF